MTISAQDVYDRADAAKSAFEIEYKRWRDRLHEGVSDLALFNESWRRHVVSLSWRCVADRVRAGVDPIIAVLERE